MQGLSFLVGGSTLVAVLMLLGSSVAEVAEALTSSLLASWRGTLLFGSRGATGATLLVIQSSLIDIKLIIS